MSQARLSHSHCIWKMHVLEWNDTDDAFEVDGEVRMIGLIMNFQKA